MKRAAFTLIELLVVVAIIATLMAILLPSLKMAREQARDVVCRSNIGQVTRGFLYYAADYKNYLPGSTWDFYRINGRERPLDWLGVGRTRDMLRAPEQGTIFKYLNDAKVYRCPSHRLAHEADSSAGRTIEHQTSYVAPVILSGASIEWLRRVLYPRIPPGDASIPTRQSLTDHMMPVLVVAEDVNWYLSRSYDSAWSNVDQFTDRHRGAGALGYVDGHAELRKLPKRPRPLTSWHLMYEMNDGRLISGGHWGGAITFGWIRDKATDR